jgi:hypothetical protein
LPAGCERWPGSAPVNKALRSVAALLLHQPEFDVTPEFDVLDAL